MSLICAPTMRPWTTIRPVEAVMRPRRCPLLCISSSSSSSIRNPTLSTARRILSELAAPPPPSGAAGGGGPTGTNASTASSIPLLVSRRAFLEVQNQPQQQHAAALTAAAAAPTSKSKSDETPWPRNVVYAFYAACSILIPFSVAWFLASNETWRTRLLGNSEDDKSSSTVVVQRTILQAMRNLFGEVDEQALSEPERVALLVLQQQQQSSSAGSTTYQPLPHKFVDEPTVAVRRRQAQIEHQHQRDQMTVVRLYYVPSSDKYDNTTSSNDDEASSSTVQVSLPAATRANPDAVRRALQQHAPHIPQLAEEPAPLALDFPVSEPENNDNETLDVETTAPTTTTTTTSSSLMSIYSLWHHHSSPLSNTAARTMSDLELHLSRLNHEIATLQQELQTSSSSSRAIDDIQTELRQKQSERRRWRRKQWLGV